MATRFNRTRTKTFGVSPLPTGYDQAQSPDLTIPSVGIEDVDRGLFNLFDKELPLHAKSPDGVKKVPIIFASGEKWAMLKKGPPKDKNGSLIIPLIVITRTSIKQSSSEDIVGRGINQQTGEIVIKRRISNTNKDYQSLVNKLLIKNQTNVAEGITSQIEEQITTDRVVGDLKNDPTISRGGLLVDKNKKNTIWETITVPAPQFFTSTYEVTIWTQYTQQMNSILENIMSSFLPQGNQWRIETQKGYWFVATVDGNMYDSQNNFDDMSQTERMLKYKFSINIPGYILAPAGPGLPVPIRRYVSNPDITFTINNTDEAELSVGNPFIGSDDPTLPKTNANNSSDNQRNTTSTRLYPNKTDTPQDDPSLSSYGRNKPNQYKKVSAVDSEGNTVEKYVKITSTNKFTGESTMSISALDGLTVVQVSD